MANNFHSDRFDAEKSNAIYSNQVAKLIPEQLSSIEVPENDEPAERRQAANRRESIWRAFLYGNFRPRRRSSRREADEHQYIFDWHEPRTLYLALTVLLLSCIDALFTLNLLKAGAAEANAVMASMLEGGIDRFLVAKIGLTSSSLVILVALARRKFISSFSVEHVLQTFCAGYVLVICYELYLFRYVFNLNVFPSLW